MRVSPRQGRCPRRDSQESSGKIRTLLGESVIRQIQGKVVIDFGCGSGTEAVELALNGARKVIGIDIRESVLSLAREKARRAGVEAHCEFCSDTTMLADVIITLDAFEHFCDPESILRKMYSLLKPGGAVLAGFGPTWYHPYGGHLFSAFPWAHLLFSEAALLRWRSTFRRDGACRFGEVSGGLNQMTVRRFERLLQRSNFSIDLLETVPIHRLAFMHNSLTREFTTSVVRCRLVKSASERAKAAGQL